MALEHELTPAQLKDIDKVVHHFVDDPTLRKNVNVFQEGLLTQIKQKPLCDLFHSYRSRIKDPGHLRHKLIKKFEKYSTDGKLNVSTKNLGLEINDLVGVRILHLHTHQIVQINAALTSTLADFGFELREGPVARTWDDELKEYYKNVGIKTVSTGRMYTSVHYVVNLNNAKKDLTAEIQVRTLAEELWGEVDHSLNYPDENPNEACREQIKVLARLTSGATRLVDSIYLTDRMEREKNAKAPGPAAEG